MKCTACHWNVTRTTTNLCFQTCFMWTCWGNLSERFGYLRLHPSSSIVSIFLWLVCPLTHPSKHALISGNKWRGQGLCGQRQEARNCPHVITYSIPAVNFGFGDREDGSLTTVWSITQAADSWQLYWLTELKPWQKKDLYGSNTGKHDCSNVVRSVFRPLRVTD